MRGVIKGVLYEELQNSLRMKKGYEKSLNELPKGCLSVKKIGNHQYFYLVIRQGKKVKYSYKGKMSSGEIAKYEEAKMYRGKYRKLLAQAKKQIRFLRSSLRGKETV